MSNDLSVKIAGLELGNPLLPGSGPPGDSLNKLHRLESAGIGALVTKTISVAVPHVPKPCMAFDGELFFNVEKWSDRPYQEWLDKILPALSQRSIPLVVSLGYTPDDLARLIPLFDPLVDGFELSTHYVEGGTEQLTNTVRKVKALTGKPLIMKLSAHGGDLVERAQACERGGADAIAAINSIGPVLAIDIEKRASRLGEEQPYAWLSGPAIKPLALRAVYDVAHAVQIPVIGCGGISNARDVVEFILAGATAVQLCTALIRKGPDLIPQILHDLNVWCASHHVSRLSDLRGKVTPHFIPSTPTSS
jgi:dihydroorotate dehydrogenase subfamily 1